MAASTGPAQGTYRTPRARPRTNPPARSLGRRALSRVNGRSISVPTDGMRYPIPTRTSKTMPASRSESCGRCSRERISDPARTTRLKLRTRPAITASGRARPVRGVRTAGPALPAGGAGPVLSVRGPDPATSTIGRTGRMHGEMPARNPATKPTTTSTTMPLPFCRTVPESAWSYPHIRCRPRCVLAGPLTQLRRTGRNSSLRPGRRTPSRMVNESARSLAQ